MRIIATIGALCLSVLLAIAQRPNIQWHLDAVGNRGLFAMDATEGGDYLLLGETSSLKLHQLSWLFDQSRPLGASLVSYWYGFNRGVQLTDRCDNANGPEYVWSLGFVFRLIRSSTTFGGAYIERRPGSFSAPQNAQLTALLALRGNSANRAYNRLAAVGFSNGELRLLSVREPSNPASPPVVQQEVAIPAAHPGGLTALTYDPATQRLVSGGVDGIIRVWRISGALGNLTLTPVAQVANGWGAVQSLNFVNTSTNQRLLLAASEAHLVSARAWNNGNPPVIPLWTTYIDTALFADYSFFDGAGYLTLPNPEPRSGLATVQALFTDTYGGHRGAALLLDPDTGAVVYHFSAPLWAYNVTYSSRQNLFFRAPSGDSYAVGVWGDLHRLNLSRPLTVGLHTQPATAVRERGGFVAVGYADGLLRVYARSGNTWNLQATNNTVHANARIVALFWTGSGNALRLVSIDSLGHVRAWTSSLGTPTADLDLNYEVADADIRADSQIAVIGQEAGANTGAPRASIITWNGAAFTLSSNFTPAGAAPSKAIRFAPDGSLLTLTYNGWGRYSGGSALWSGTAYPANISLAATSRRVYIGSNQGLWAGRIANGGGLLSWDSRASTRALVATDTSNPDQDELVWGAGFTLPGGAYYHQLRRGVFTDFNGCTNFNTQFGAVLPDEPLSVARDSSNPDGFYVACADGTVLYTTLPAPRPKPLAYAAFSTPSDIQVGQVAAYLIEQGQAWGFIAGPCPAFQHRMARLNPSTGAPADLSTPQRDSMYTYYSPSTQLSPSGNTVWSLSERSLTSFTLSAWTGSNPINQSASHTFARSDYLRTFVSLSDTQVATLQAYRTNIQDNQGQYLWAWRLVWRDYTTQNGGLGLELASTPLVDSAGVPLHSLWGDLDIEPWARPLAVSPDRLRVAVMGPQRYPDPNSTRSISVWRRTGVNQWNWALQRVLKAGQDWINVTPVSMTFHPRFADLLYVGMNNGEMWLYNLSTYTPNPSNPRNATGLTIYTPTLGSPGQVEALDTGELVASNGYRYTVLAFGGGNGISVWATSPCNPGVLREVDFYNIDAQFKWIRLQQQQGVPFIDLTYGTEATLTRAAIPEPQRLACPGDVNNDRRVDDADLLQVLFNFGAVNCFCPADVNCDGIIDDADLLIVLFNFGNRC